MWTIGGRLLHEVSECDVSFIYQDLTHLQISKSELLEGPSPEIGLNHSREPRSGRQAAGEGHFLLETGRSLAGNIERIGRPLA